MEKEFTKQAQHVLETAKVLAKKMKHPYIGTEHVLLALRKEFMGVAGQVLESNKVDEEKITKLIMEMTATVEEGRKGKLSFSPRLEFLLDNALLDADRLKSEKINFHRNGSGVMLPGILSLSFPGYEGETLLHRLDLMGIQVSTGSACDSVNTQISHVLKAIKVEEEIALGTIRISLGKDNTFEDVNAISSAICKIVKGS